MARKTYDKNFKAKVALEAIKGEKTIQGTSKKPSSVSGLIFSAISALSKCSFSPAKLRFWRLELTKNIFARIQKRFFRGTFQELASQYGVHPNQITKWKKTASG